VPGLKEEDQRVVPYIVKAFAISVVYAIAAQIPAGGQMSAPACPGSPGKSRPAVGRNPATRQRARAKWAKGPQENEERT